MKIIFKPQSYLGKWSIALIFMVPIFVYIGMSFVDFYISVPAGESIPQDIIVRPGIALPILSGFICGIIAFCIGMISITRKKDYSVSVFLSTAVGFSVLLWVLAEIIFPLI